MLGLCGGFLAHHNGYSNACTALSSRATYGTEYTGNSYDDLANARIILLWSANLAETFLGTGAPWHIRRAREAGARIVYIDPIYTDTALLADEWVPIYPGTDNALMDAMAYVMISEGLHDRAFLDRYCVGFDDDHLPPGVPAGSSYESYLLGWVDGIAKTPGWAERITGVPVETIVRLARDYATLRPGALVEGWGAQRAAYGEQPTRGAATLAAMTGNIGVSGGWAAGMGVCGRRMYIPSVPVSNPVPASIPVFLWTDAITRGIEMTSADGLRGAERLGSNIKLIMNIQGNTLINQHSHVNYTASLLRDPSLVEFILVSDQFLTSSARFADVVFPSTMWFEREDIALGSHSGEYALYLNKAVEPLGEARSDYWAMSQLADRLGVGQPFTEGRDEDGWLRHLAAQGGILEFDEFKRSGAYRRVSETPHVAFSDFRRDPIGNPLATPSGKVEIYSMAAARMGNPVEIPAVPGYLEPWEGRSDPLARCYPLQMVTPHSRYRTHSIFANVPWLQEISTDGAMINPLDAAPRRIRDGDRVRVWNDRGATLLPARVTERIMPGVVAIYQGTSYSPRVDGVDEGGCANVLTSLRPSPWAKGNTQHSNLVQVAREDQR